MDEKGYRERKVCIDFSRLNIKLAAVRSGEISWVYRTAKELKGSPATPLKISPENWASKSTDDTFHWLISQCFLYVYEFGRAAAKQPENGPRPHCTF